MKDLKLKRHEEKIAVPINKSVSKTFDQNSADALAPSRAEKFLALNEEDIEHFTWYFRRSKR